MTKLTLIGVIFSLQTSAALAGSLRHKAKLTKDSVPTQEDFQNYVSTANNPITDEQRSQADDINQKTVRSIEELLRDPKLADHRKFELYLRLGELYLERHEYMRDAELTQFEKKHDAWSKTQKGVEPKVSDKRSREEILRAVNAFRRLVEKFPKHPRTDAALYSLAKTLARLENENCILYFNQLIKNYPQSPLIAETYLALGEYHFDKHNIAKATDAYKEAIKYKEAKTYPFAVYKLGWAFYNAPASNNTEQEKNLNRALTAFKLVIKLNKKEAVVTTKFNLRQEAINDLVMVWADVEGVDQAWEYFQSISETKAFYDLLERLGGIYAEKGRYDDAVKAYERLIREDPSRASSHQVYTKLLSLHEKTNKYDAVVSDLAAMKALYIDDSKWTAANADNKEILAEAREKTGASMHRYGAMFHNRGDKTNNDAMRKSAARIYGMYLASFENTDASYEVRFYLAELLMHFNQFEVASDEYLKVSKQKVSNPKFKKDAALNAVIAISKVDSSAKFPALPAAGKVPSPMPIPKVKEKLVAALDNFVSLIPKDELGHPMRFTAAQTYFDYGHYPEAIERFEKITLELPQKKQGQASLKVIFGYYNEKKEWDELVRRCRTYADNKALLAAGMGEQIQLNLKKGVYQKALALESAKKHHEAAVTFVSFQGEFPKDDNADRALFNAAVNYYKVGEVDGAIEASKKLLAAYPSSKMVPDVMVDVATTWEAQAQFADAAGMYRKFSEKYPSDQRAPGALYNAALLFKGLGQADAAVSLLTRFTKEYGKNSLASEAVFEQGTIRESQKNFPAAITAFEDVVKREGKNSDSDRRYLAWTKAAQLKVLYANRKDGDAEFLKIRRELAKKSAPAVVEARAIIAKTMFRTAETDFFKFKTLKLTSAQALEKEAGVKQALLVTLAQRYEDIIDVGCGELTVASLLRLGEVHENFAAELLAVPPPAGGSQVAVDNFKSTVEKAAFPLRDESVKFFETAYLRAREVETFSDWTRQAYQKMVELNPAKYPAITEQNAEASYMSHRMSWEGAITALAE